MRAFAYTIPSALGIHARPAGRFRSVCTIPKGDAIRQASR